MHDNLFTRENHRLHRIGQIINIKNRHSLQFTHLIQVKIIGYHLAAQHFCQLDQLAVHFRDFLKITFVDQDLHIQLFLDFVQDIQDLHIQLFLDFVQDIQPAPSAVAFQQIRRIGNMLQLLQNEFRDYDSSPNKSRFADIGNPPVNNDACIQNLVFFQPAAFRLRCLSPAAGCPQRSQLLFLFQPNPQPHIPERKRSSHLQQFSCLSKPGHCGIQQQG
ncbi:hypothetical protein D3C73_975990 [compost metagenome]